jgi:hypothetical protein
MLTLILQRNIDEATPTGAETARDFPGGPLLTQVAQQSVGRRPREWLDG